MATIINWNISAHDLSTGQTVTIAQSVDTRSAGEYLVACAGTPDLPAVSGKPTMGAWQDARPPNLPSLSLWPLTGHVPRWVWDAFQRSARQQRRTVSCLVAEILEEDC
jgi:hypothetical protein